MIRTRGLGETQVVDVGEELYGGGAAVVAGQAEGDAAELEGLQKRQVNDHLLVGVASHAERVVSTEQICVRVRRGLVEAVAASLHELIVDANGSMSAGHAMEEIEVKNKKRRAVKWADEVRRSRFCSSSCVC